MKLRLTQPGFEDYNGQMGVVIYEAGISVGDVSVRDAIRISAALLCEWEDGSSPNIAQSILNNANTPAPIFKTGAEGQHDLDAAKIGTVAQQVAKPVSKSEFTVEGLGAIADAEGIKGLRKIADPLGIKSNSIAEMIDAIMRSTPTQKS
jgi:hypothetical protein